MLLEPYILIAWVALLLVVLLAFGLKITLKSYGLIARPTRDMNIMFLECFILIAWLILLLVALVAFGIYAVTHGY